MQSRGHNTRLFNWKQYYQRRIEYSQVTKNVWGILISRFVCNEIQLGDSKYIIFNVDKFLMVKSQGQQEMTALVLLSITDKVPISLGNGARPFFFKEPVNFNQV